MRVSSIIALFACLTVTGPTAADVPSQLHDPSGCSPSDVSCIREAYLEYKAGILTELEEYRQLEDRIGRAFYAHDDMEASSIAGLVMKLGLYRHNHWNFPTPEQLAAAKVPFAEWESLWSDCRTAVIEIKYLVVAVMGERDATEDRRDYLESVRKCEKNFKLKPIQSALRK